jgi:hypothetical protein
MVLDRRRRRRRGPKGHYLYSLAVLMLSIGSLRSWMLGIVRRYAGQVGGVRLGG